MKKRIAAGLFCLLLAVQSVGSVAAADLSASPLQKQQYVVSGESMEQIEQVLDTELAGEITEETPAGAEAMEEAGIALARLSSGEIRRLEKADIQVEEDLEFTAAMQEPYEPEPEGAPAGEPETEGETEAERSQEPGTVLGLEPEAEPQREAEQQEEATGQGEAKKKAEAAVEWNLTAVHAQPDTTEAAAGEPVKIAVLDSGINYRPDLPVAGHVTMLEGKEEGNPVFEDTSGHGTGVASLIGGLPGGEGIRGMNQAASVYCVQVLDGEKGKLSGIVRGIYWCIENGMDMINMSFGTGQDSEILHKAVRDASQAGLLIIAAAGNGGGTKAMYPAAYQEVISAGSSDMSGEIAEGSVRGSQVDLYAPGERILVQRIINSRHIDLSDCPSAALLSIAVATATTHSAALHMKQSSGANVSATYYSLY